MDLQLNVFFYVTILTNTEYGTTGSEYEYSLESRVVLYYWYCFTCVYKRLILVRVVLPVVRYSVLVRFEAWGLGIEDALYKYRLTHEYSSTRILVARRSSYCR
jgi:hypothetical protein